MSLEFYNSAKYWIDISIITIIKEFFFLNEIYHIHIFNLQNIDIDIFL